MTLKMLRKKEFMVAIQHLADIIQNQQNKQCKLVTILGMLHLDNVSERQGLTLYWDEQLKQQLKQFHPSRKKETWQISCHHYHH